MVPPHSSLLSMLPLNRKCHRKRNTTILPSKCRPTINFPSQESALLSPCAARPAPRRRIALISPLVGVRIANLEDEKRERTLRGETQLRSSVSAAHVPPLARYRGVDAPLTSTGTEFCRSNRFEHYRIHQADATSWPLHECNQVHACKLGNRIRRNRS